MTRWQLALIATVSLLSTVFVLTSGAAREPVEIGRLAADRRPVTIGAATTAAASASDAGDGQADAGGDDAEAASADDVTDTVATFDGGGEEAAAEAPAEAAAPAETSEPTADGADEAGGGDAGAGDAGAGEGGSGGTGESGGEEAADAPVPTKIRHVFVIALAGQGFDATFGPGSAAAYLNGKLRPKGVLLDGYTSLGGAGLPDRLAMIGGQPPNADTRGDCAVFREIPPANAPSRTGVISVDGCVYPNTVATLGDQLTASRRPWRAYVEDLDRGPDGKKTCRRPASNAADDTLRGRPGDGYATRYNPFVYFHSLLDLGDCDAKVGGLGGLERDLRSVKTTPAYSFIAPNLCNGGGEAPCADGRPGGLPAADAFLAEWAPRILASPAYRKDGLLIVTFAGGPPPADPAAAPPATEPVRNGALLVSRFAQAGSTAGGAYDPYSLLRSVEDLFALRPLALAARARSFAPTVLGRAFVEAPSDG